MKHGFVLSPLRWRSFVFYMARVTSRACCNLGWTCCLRLLPRVSPDP